MATKKTKKGKQNMEIVDSIRENALKSTRLNIKQFKLSEKQKKFLHLATAETTKIIFIEGVAGTGKSYLSILAALQMYNVNNNYEIKYIRTIIESADRGLGSLPGFIEQKFDPFIAPLQEKLEELLSNEDQKKLFKDKIIEAMPVNFVRGASWKNKIVLIEETQNFSVKELITALTRIGENTKIFVCGDSMQSDINSKSGFLKIMNLFDNEESRAQGIFCVKFTEEDIVRSEILKFLVKKFKQL